MSKSQFKLLQGAKYYFNLSYIIPVHGSHFETQKSLQSKSLIANLLKTTLHRQKYGVIHERSLREKNNVVNAVYLLAAEYSWTSPPVPHHSEFGS